MKILGLDTALGACSAALMVDGEVITHDHQTRSRGHAEALIPMVRSVLGQAALTIPELDRIAVTVGPGTFTGVRIGLAAARGFGVAGGVPLVGVSTLEVLAVAAARQLSAAPAWPFITVVIDARRGGVYRQAFKRCRQPPLVAAVGPPALVAVAAAAGELNGPTMLVGSAAAAIYDRIKADGAAVACPDVAAQPDAGDVARLGSLGPAAPPGHPPSPLYLRPPDAKLPAPKQP